MAYNENLAARIRSSLSHLSRVQEKKMFGGLAFMINKKMCITVGPDRIMCRIDPDLHEEAITKKGCSTVIMRGRPYKGWVHISEDELKSAKALAFWTNLAVSYNKLAKPAKK